jgi:signal transduction histidine kinase
VKTVAFNPRSSTLLILSRYLSYIAIFISSILMIDGDLKSILFASFLFVIVLLNSSIRITRLEGRDALFIASILWELPVIIFMQKRFDSLAFIFIYIAVVDVYMELEFSRAVWLSVPMFLSIMYSIIDLSRGIDAANLVGNTAINLAVFVFFAGAAYMIRLELKRKKEIQGLYNELEKSKDELEEANQRLVEYAKKIESVTIVNERNRMAGEIHDTIGHHLTALIMEIDICKKLLDRDVKKAAEELGKASSLARNALSEVRRSVRELKPEDMEKHMGINSIGELVRDFERNTKIIVKLNVSKLQYKLSPTTEVTIYRTIQEALTNCARYGMADIVTISINFVNGRVELCISDNGQGCGELVMGVGLKTMEERIHAIGGDICFSGSGGFMINAVIPVEVA